MQNEPLPLGWDVWRLGELAEIVMGQAPPGSSVIEGIRSTDEPGLPFVQGAAEFGAKHPMPKKWCLEPIKVCQRGDTLITVRAPVGEMNIADQALCIGRGLAAVRFIKIDQNFGRHQLTRRRSAFDRTSQGSTFLAINASDLLNLPLPTPDASEQRAIACVLDSIDGAIEKTEAVIEATERTRRGLLQELLSQGLPGRHKEWKEVRGVGTMPADWTALKLCDVAEVQTGRAVSKNRKFRDAVSVPYLSVANVKDGYLDLTTVKTMTVDRPEVERYQLRDGDVLFTEGGDADKLGRGTVWRAELDLCLHQNHVFAVRPDRKRLSPEFLAAYAASQHGKSYFQGSAKQTTNLASINSIQLKEMPLPMPPLDEQHRLIGVLAQVDSATLWTRDALLQLIATKRATADKLLSGRVRVASGSRV